MSSASSSLWTKTVAVGIVAVASVVGNVSLSASETTQRYGKVPAVAFSGVDAAVSRPATVAAPSRDPLSGFGYSRFDSSTTPAEDSAVAKAPSEIPDGNAPDETGQVVPAIYAWDPDVRFVFYRHVSKWM